MKPNKRIVGALLAFALLLGALFVTSSLISAESAAAVGSGWSGYVQWVLTDDGVMRVYGSGAMKNYTTKTEMPWYKYAGQIEALVIEDGVTSVGSYAFYGMPALRSVEMADSVTSIGDYAFKNAAALETVEMPARLSNLGDSAFYACTSLRSIEIPASLYTVKPYAFKNCTALAEVIFHEGNLMKLSDGAFYGCTSLTQIEFPACLDIIDGYCFKGCSALASITIPEGDLTQIREAVFYGSAIPSITIPEGVTSIKPYAFKNCTKLVSVELPESLTSVGEASFYACTRLESLDLPDAVTEIGNYAFRKCSALESVRFSESLEDIGESSFYGCESLTEIAIPDRTAVIQGYAFKGCTALTAVELGQNMRTLGESAFYGCTELKKIIFPLNVESVGSYCFSRDTALKFISFIGEAPSIGVGAFKDVVSVAYYRGGSSWTADKLQNYGGSLTWEVLGGGIVVNTYDVTFVDYDGTILKTERVEAYDAATAPAAPTRAGYIFIGWDKDFSCVMEDMTVTALYEKIQGESYTVTFVDYNGAVLAEQTVAEGMDAAPPAAPAKSGADFLGWTGNYANVTQDETVRAVYSDEKNVILVHSASGTAGGTVTVLVEVTGVVKTCGFDFDLFFDPALELKSYDNDLHLDVVFNADAYDHGVSLNFSATTDKVKPREIVELTFQIDEAASGALPITVQMTSIKELSGSRIVDTDYVLVGGVITVE